jgi:hypothetical protein
MTATAAGGARRRRHHPFERRRDFQLRRALVIEGRSATVHSKTMQIDGRERCRSGGDRCRGDPRRVLGELTARTRLVVHGTGRVSGTILRGKLIVAEGGVSHRRHKQPTQRGRPQPLPSRTRGTRAARRCLARRRATRRERLSRVQQPTLAAGGWAPNVAIPDGNAEISLSLQ